MTRRTKSVRKDKLPSVRSKAAASLRVPPALESPELGAARVGRCIRGSIAYFDFDGVIGRALELYGEWAENEIGFLRQFVREGSVAIDAGANIGTHTLALAEFVGRAGSVVSIEASSEVCLLLKRTVLINKLRNVRVINAALLGSRQIVEVPPLNPGVMSNVGGLRVQSAASGQMRSITLDSLKISAHVSFIKLDVEGVEPAVLGGARALLAKHRPTICCEVLNVDTGAELLTMMSARGYRAYFASFAAYNAANFRANKENSFGHAHEASLIFVPPDQPIPRQTQGVHLYGLTSVEGLAKCFFEMPRYGDETPYDRVAERLVEERRKREHDLTALQQDVEVLQASLRTQQLASQASQAEMRHEKEMRQALEVENRSLREEIGRRERDLSSATRLLENRQKQIALLLSVKEEAARLKPPDVS